MLMNSFIFDLVTHFTLHKVKIINNDDVKYCKLPTYIMVIVLQIKFNRKKYCYK